MTVSNGTPAHGAVRGVLPSQVAKAITSFVGAATKAERVKSKAAMLLFDCGVSSDLVRAPEKGMDDDPITVNGTLTTRGEFHTEIKEDIVLGFSAAVRKLLDSPVKSLDDGQKTDRRYWQQQIGSRQKDLRKALERMEARENGDEAGTPNHTRTPATRISECVNNAIKIAQVDESPDYDATKLVATLQAALKLVNTDSESESE